MRSRYVPHVNDERSVRASCEVVEPSTNNGLDDPANRRVIVDRARENMKTIGRVLVAFIAAVAALFVGHGTSHAGMDNQLTLVAGDGDTLHESSSEGSDVGRRDDTAEHDRWLRDNVPPHYR